MKKKVLKITSLIVIMLIVITNCSSIMAATIEKKATNLDSKFDTKIKISIENENDETNKIVDIVGVFDVYGISTDTGKNMINKLYELSNELKSEGVTANIALVGYGNGSKVFMELTNCDDITSQDYITAKVSENVSWTSDHKNGSNIESGLKRAKKILDESTTGSAVSDRHLILLTDGASYTFDNNDVSSCTVYDMGGLYMSIGNMDSNGELGNAGRATKSVQYLGTGTDYKGAFTKLVNDDGEAIEEMIANSGYAYQISSADTAAINALKASGDLKTYSASEISNFDVYPYVNMELGDYAAAKVLQSINSKGYNIYTIGYFYEWGFGEDDSSYILKLLAIPSRGFVEWTETQGELYFEKAKTISEGKLAEYFSDIKAKINSAGNTEEHVIDEMGFGTYEDGSDYDFEFVNDIDKIDISVDGTKLDKTESGSKTYTFSNDNGNIILKYYPDGISGTTSNECIKVSYDKTIGAKIEIEYHETLTESSRKTEAGKYGEYDEDGSKKLEGLKTNKSATLYAADGTIKRFNTPTVSYEVEEQAEESSDEEITSEEQKSEEKKEKNSSKVKTGDTIAKYTISIVVASIISVFAIRLRDKKKSKH